MKYHPFTLLQSLYWQREELRDEAWRLEQKIKRSKKTSALMVGYNAVIEQIGKITERMNAIENMA